MGKQGDTSFLPSARMDWYSNETMNQNASFTLKMLKLGHYSDGNATKIAPERN